MWRRVPDHVAAPRPVWTSDCECIFMIGWCRRLDAAENNRDAGELITWNRIIFDTMTLVGVLAAMVEMPWD